MTKPNTAGSSSKTKSTSDPRTISIPQDIRATEPVELDNEVAGEDTVHAFTEESADLPYLTFTTPPGHIAEITCKIWSHDQGWSDDWRHHNTYDASHTWFEVRYQGTAKDLAPLVIQRNLHASAQLRHHAITWVAGQQSTAGINAFMSALEPGDEVGIHAKAQYRGWVNYVYGIRVEIMTLSGDGQRHQFRFSKGGFDEVDKRVDRTEPVDDLDRPINVAEMAVNATPQDHLNRAVEVAEVAVNATPQNHPDRAGRLDNLGILLGIRFERMGSMDDLNRAVEVAEVAVSATPHDSAYRASFLNNLGNSLGTRFERTGSMDDLNRAVDIANIVVNATPQDSPDRARYLNSLGNSLGTRFKRAGLIGDLDRAVDAASMAVDSAPEGSPDRAGCLSNLGAWLSTRFERTGSMDDLNRAVEVANTAVNATPHDSAYRASFLNNLGNSLGTRFERTGSMDDLNRAVDIANIVVNATPQDSPDRARYLNNLGVRLGRRFERTGSMDDLNRAIDVANTAVNATPQDSPDQALLLNNLGDRLGTRFERTGSMDDLDRAVDVANTAVNATPQDSPNRASFLDLLGNWLGRRFERTGSMDDLNRAVEVANTAVNATPHDSAYRASFLNNLGNSLSRRFERTGSMDDLNRAVDIAKTAVNATPHDSSDRAMYYTNLGNSLRTRHKCSGSIDDLNRSISSFREGWECRSSPPSLRVRLAMELAVHLATKLDWEGASTLLEEAVELLPTVSLRSLQHTDKQHALAEFAGLASMAAATALNAGKTAYHALKLLELGRGVIAGLLLEMRSDVFELDQHHPVLAREFVSLRDELDSHVDATAIPLVGDASSADHKADRRWSAEKRFKEVLAEIRSKEGFENFLLPPTEDEVKMAASAGPIVVINVSAYRCDAFLVRHDYPISVVELPILQLEGIKSYATSLRAGGSYRVQQMLEWLWNVAASPILDALNLKQTPSDSNWPHIWWIPTGQLSQLPLHAAGRHSKSSTDAVLDRAMSSYSPSIKALVYGRRHQSRNTAQQMPEDAVLVTVPGSGLRFAGREVAMLEDICPSLGLNPKSPAPKREEILAHLRTSKIFHFASHGHSNPTEPSESCLVLGKDEVPITVADLRDCRLQESSPFLAYLSACSTKVNQAERLVDEEIHLVSACQLAGFRHVVGTLWEVSDEHCVDVARVLYETLRDKGMTDTAVCWGLHRAIKILRDRNIATARIEEAITDGDGDELRQSDWGISSNALQLSGPLLWAAYIHAGL